MTYNFDEIIDRRNTNSENVEGWRPYIFHCGPERVFPYKDEEFIRMWVADMEFGVAPEILEALHSRVFTHRRQCEHPAFQHRLRPKRSGAFGEYSGLYRACKAAQAFPCLQRRAEMLSDRQRARPRICVCKPHLLVNTRKEMEERAAPRLDPRMRGSDDPRGLTEQTNRG